MRLGGQLGSFPQAVLTPGRVRGGTGRHQGGQPLRFPAQLGAVSCQADHLDDLDRAEPALALHLGDQGFGLGCAPFQPGDDLRRVRRR
jgi:hypothetical protein